MKLWLGSLLSLCITAAGLFALAAGTHGYSVWTEEGQRRWQALHHPTPLPQMEWRNQNYAARSLAGLNKSIVVLDFVYTRCPTVCQLMGYQFGRLQALLKEKQLQDSVQLVSMSFDADHDTPAMMAEYLARYRADTAHWEGGIIEDKTRLLDLLDHLGVVVLPDDQGGFVHNAAFYLVYEGSLISIYDRDQVAQIIEAIERLRGVF